VEKSVGFLRRVSGHTFDTIYDLLFTSRRVIALIVEHPGDVQRKFGMAEMFIGGQLGKRGERIEKKRIAEERRRLYEEKGVDELKGLHHLNFEIHVRDIASIEVDRGLLESSIKFHLSGDSRPGRTVRFRLKRNQVEEARKLADETLALKSDDRS
jgi:hypothetical protein